MSLESGFEQREQADAGEFQSWLHIGAEASEGQKELDGGRRSGMEKVGNVEKILQIRTVKVG